MTTVTAGAYLLEIAPDECPENPRDWDHLGTMACWHRRYALGDRHGYRDLQAFAAEVTPRTALIIPLYLFDHSGLSIGADPTPFRAADPQAWDWGPVGFIFATKDAVRRAFGVRRLTRAVVIRALDALRAELAVYDQYLRGEVFGYVLKETATGKVVDACAGFYGGDPLENGMADSLPDEVAAALWLDARGGAP